jgi:FolB domain-containing protein
MSANIRVLGIECSCRVGVPEEERAQPQKIVLDLDLLQTPGEPFVDYFEVYKEAKAAAEGEPFELIEELGAAVMERVSSLFVLEKLKVRVHKWPAVMPGVEVVAELERAGH